MYSCQLRTYLQPSHNCSEPATGCIHHWRRSMDGVEAREGGSWSHLEQPPTRISRSVVFDGFSLPCPIMSHAEMEPKNAIQAWSVAVSAALSLHTHVVGVCTPHSCHSSAVLVVCGAPSDVHTPCSVYCLPPLQVPIQNGRYRACINHHSHPGQPWHHLASCPAQGMLLQPLNGHP